MSAEACAPPPMRPTWAEIDLERFARNVDIVRSLLPDGAGLVAVLKADAYGHGAVDLAQRIEKRVSMIATSLLEESLELRRAGVELPLLVLGPISKEQIREAVDARITIGIPGPEELALAAEASGDRDVTIHLKLDSGMGRMGIVEEELREAIALVRAHPRIKVGGIYTHLANADEPEDDFTGTQIEAFDRMTGALRAAGVDAPVLHFANSAATLRRLVRPGDLARVGIALYGPAPIATENGTIGPVMRWRTEIARLKTLPPGHAIGYGTTFRTSRESRIATLPVGYADGYSRRLSNIGNVLVRGVRAPVVGRVSMDLVTIDVTDVRGVSVGDEVVLIGRQAEEMITADEIAQMTGTISYEVFCAVSARVPRFYRDGATTRVRSRFLA